MKRYMRFIALGVFIAVLFTIYLSTRNEMIIRRGMIDEHYLHDKKVIDRINKILDREFRTFEIEDFILGPSFSIETTLNNVRYRYSIWPTHILKVVVEDDSEGGVGLEWEVWNFSEFDDTLFIELQEIIDPLFEKGTN